MSSHPLTHLIFLRHPLRQLKSHYSLLLHRLCLRQRGLHRQLILHQKHEKAHHFSLRTSNHALYACPGLKQWILWSSLPSVLVVIAQRHKWLLKTDLFPTKLHPLTKQRTWGWFQISTTCILMTGRFCKPCVVTSLHVTLETCIPYHISSLNVLCTSTWYYCCMET